MLLLLDFFEDGQDGHSPTLATFVGRRPSWVKRIWPYPTYSGHTQHIRSRIEKGM
jgi:hypothetical protein